MVGQNDFKTGDPIVTGSGSVDYTQPLFNLGGPMGLTCTLQYNRAMNNWWSDIRTYFPTHGDANYFWLPPLSAAIDVGESGHDVILPGGEKVSFIKDGDNWVLNEVDTTGFRENSIPIRYAAATSGESANRFWVMDPSRDLLLVYDYTGVYWSEGKLLYTMDRNGNTLSFSYDGNRIHEITDGLGRTLAFAFDLFDGKWYLDRITDQTDSGITFGATYDDAGRIATATYNNDQFNVTYTYDARGLLTRVTDSLTGASVDFSHDNDGRITTITRSSGVDTTFTRDGASRLIATGDATLTYNGLSDLRTRQSSGVTIRYHYNHALDLHPLVGEYNVTTGAWKRFHVLAPGGQLLYAIDPAVAPATAAAVSFYHFDSTGNALFLTDAAGSVTDTYAYSPYGRLLAHDGANDQPFTFAGAWQIRREGDADLYQMRARYYDARTAAFLSREPLWPRLATPAALNPYQYAARDPNRFVDVTGEAEQAKNDVWNYNKFGDTWYRVSDDPEEQAKNSKESAAGKKFRESQSDAAKAPGKQQDGPTEIKLSGDWHGADGQLQTAPITLGTGGGR